MHQHRRRHLGSSCFGSSRSRFGQAARREFWFKPLTSWPGRSPRVGQAARRELARPCAMPPANGGIEARWPEVLAEEKDKDAVVRMEKESKLDGLDAGSLQCILGFLLFHDPILQPYYPSMHVGHRDLVFWYDGSRYKATTWRPRTHFGRCQDHCCGCCRARYPWDTRKGCQECYTGWALSTVSMVFREATKLNARRTSSCTCGECASSWIAVGWDCPLRCRSEFGVAIWDLSGYGRNPVSRADAHG